MPSVWKDFTVVVRVLPDKMTVWGKMWWQNSCGGWPRQSCCVCVQGHLLTWHIYSPLSDIWKGYKLSILISKTRIEMSNTSHRRQRQVSQQHPFSPSVAACFHVISSSFHLGVVQSLHSGQQTERSPFWSVIMTTCDWVVCRDVKNISPDAINS